MEKQWKEVTSAENAEQRYMEDTIIVWTAQKEKDLSKTIIKEVV